jgi:hypothetical protein
LANKEELVINQIEGVIVMKKYLLLIILIIILATACTKNEIDKTDENDVIQVINANQIKISLTTDEFNSMFKKKADETQYKDAMFELMDGTRVKADFFSYEASALFEYATAVFYKGELVSLQVITTVGINQIEEGLGMNFEEIALVEPTGNGYRIIFDSMFHDTNISVYPYEWEK